MLQGFGGDRLEKNVGCCDRICLDDGCTQFSTMNARRCVLVLVQDELDVFDAAGFPEVGVDSGGRCARELRTSAFRGRWHE
jgi:hypothetical protein